MLYKSSKGDVEISTMPLSYALNAMRKLQRTEPERTAEIEALKAHTDKLAAEAEAAALNPESRDASSDRMGIGGNNPPEAIEEPAKELNGRTAIDTHVADLLTEAGNWADGVAIESDGQAAAVGKLHRDLQTAAALVKDNATAEKKPHTEAVAEIQAWQNGYVASGLKGTPDGKLTKAIAATGRLSAAWLKKLDDERKAREKEAADAALAAAQEAIALRAEAKESSDLAVMDKAEDKLADAKALLKQAESVAKEKVRVDGGEGARALSLRTIYHARSTGEPGCWALAYGHYKTNPEFMAEFHALIQRWADRDARTEATRVRGIPGFRIDEEKVV